MKTKFHFHTVWISGASSGIGSATALKLAPYCRHLILTGRRKNLLESVAKKAKARGCRKIECIVLDVRNEKDISHFFQTHNKSLKYLQIFINNAGLAKGMASFASTPLEAHREMIETNFSGFVSLLHGALPFLIENAPQAHVILMGSVAGRWVYPNGHVYCATKAAVHALAESIRLDLLGKQVRVTEILPGMVETEFSKIRFSGDDALAKNVYRGMTPLTADDIAESILWCLLRPHHVNIQEIVIYPTDQASPQHVYRKN